MSQLLNSAFVVTPCERNHEGNGKNKQNEGKSDGIFAFWVDDVHCEVIPPSGHLSKWIGSSDPKTSASVYTRTINIHI